MNYVALAMFVIMVLGIIASIVMGMWGLILHIHSTNDDDFSNQKAIILGATAVLFLILSMKILWALENGVFRTN